MAPSMAHGKSSDNGVFLQWSCKSDTAKKLAKALQSGEQDPHIPPKIIWDKYPAAENANFRPSSPF